MVDLFLITLLAGAATSALIEFLDMLLEITVINISKSALKKTLVLPSTVGGAYLLGARLPEIVVVSAAALLVSLCITMWLDKPVVVSRPAPRLY